MEAYFWFRPQRHHICLPCRENSLNKTILLRSEWITQSKRCPPRLFSEECFSGGLIIGSICIPGFGQNEPLAF